MSKRKEFRGLEDIAGRWKVLSELAEGVEEGGELRGAVMVLEPQGEVCWTVPAGAPGGVLLFETTSAHMHNNTLTLLGGLQGWSLAFRVKGEPEQSWMVLESDTDQDGAGFSLSLVKEESSDVISDSFSLKKALDDAFFSDVVYSCLGGGSVSAHRAVLAAAYPAMQDTDWTALFHDQPLDMCHLLLSCVYSDSLPSDLTEPGAKQLMVWISRQPLLDRLAQLVSAFIEANNLKQKLISLVEDLLTLLQDAKRTVAGVVMADPVRVKYTIKQLSKDVILGGAKLCLLCQLYTSNRKEMGKADRKEVLDYLRARVVMFMDLVKELAVESVQKWEVLSQDVKLEVATELIPDVEKGWDLFLKYATSLQTSLGQSLEGSAVRAGSQTGMGVSMLLHLISRGSERKRLLKIRKEFLESLEMAQRKREQWERYSEEEKASQVLNVVSKLVNEAEDLQESMESRKRQLLLESGLEWRSFRSYVDIVCMYMTWGLRKMLTLKEPLKDLLFKALEFVGRSEVNEAVVYLGLLGEEELEAWLEEDGGLPATDSSSGKLPNCQSRLAPGLESAAESVLARGCVQLAASQMYADMDFVLGDTVIPAHRVIVASRSEWASLALQSGMREERERRITVSDVKEEIFRLFLSFLYGDSLSTGNMALDTLVDLMTVADRFGLVSLVLSCESLLADRVDDSSVFDLLTVAETLNACTLKKASLEYVVKRPEVIVEVEGFGSLSGELRQKIRDLLSGSQDPTLALRHSQSDTTTPVAHSQQPFMAHCSVSSGASSEDEEELQVEPDTLEWNIALDSVRAVIGSEVTEDVLGNLLLAADMDVNRAINFFFNNTQ